jgi:hypothetical protein
MSGQDGAPQAQRPGVLAGWLCQAWEEDIASRLWPLRVDGEIYEVCDDGQYEALGEADKDGYPLADAPLILVRKSDGRFFEIGFDAHVEETSPEARGAHREHLTRMRDRQLTRERLARDMELGLVPETADPPPARETTRQHMERWAAGSESHPGQEAQ